MRMGLCSGGVRLRLLSNKIYFVIFGCLLIAVLISVHFMFRGECFSMFWGTTSLSVHRYVLSSLNRLALAGLPNSNVKVSLLENCKQML